MKNFIPIEKCIRNFIFLCIILNTFHQANGRFASYFPYYGHGYSGTADESKHLKCPDPVLPPPSQQDKDDAANIFNHQFDEKVIASVLPFRALENRKIINIEIANLNKKKFFIPEKYKPVHKGNPPFKDLFFALVNYPITVMAMYLGEFLHRKDETYIIMVLTLCQNMKHLRCIYYRNHKNGLSRRIRKQRHPFSNLMRVWVAKDRDPEDSKFTDADVNKYLENMKKEYPHWHKDRDALEKTLIRTSLNCSLTVIQKFETDLNISIEDAIKQKIKNHDLVDAYTSLALYVKNRYNYMAKTLLERCNSIYSWAIWIMYVGYIDPGEWPKIDDEFKKINNGVSLRDHILKNLEPDKMLLQVMAVMIDENYKPDFTPSPSPPNVSI